MVLSIIVGIVAFGIIVYLGVIIYWANTHKVKMGNKTHLEFVVKEGQVVDYNAFINPQGETSVFKQINADVRLQIAKYLRDNKFKLKEGHHYFPKRAIINGNEVIVLLDEYLNSFNFEKID